MIKCDPRAKAICPFKNPCCGDETAYFVEGSECDEFNQKILAPPPTNADRIRSMSDEKLALWICGVYDIEEEHGKFINGTIIPGYAPHDIEEWLKQPVEED